MPLRKRQLGATQVFGLFSNRLLSVKNITLNPDTGIGFHRLRSASDGIVDRCQVSAQPPAKKTASLILKETLAEFFQPQRHQN